MSFFFFFLISQARGLFILLIYFPPKNQLLVSLIVPCCFSVLYSSISTLYCFCYSAYLGFIPPTTTRLFFQFSKVEAEVIDLRTSFCPNLMQVFCLTSFPVNTTLAASPEFLYVVLYFHSVQILLILLLICFGPNVIQKYVIQFPNIQEFVRYLSVTDFKFDSIVVRGCTLYDVNPF